VEGHRPPARHHHGLALVPWRTLVGFFACTAHVVDVGGRGFGADGKSVYEEGIQIPIMKFAERGRVNGDLVRLLRANVREPNQVVGDFYSLAACNDVGHRRLIAMMQEIGLPSLDAWANSSSPAPAAPRWTASAPCRKGLGTMCWTPTDMTRQSALPRR
jgi:hypothetical protein